MTRKDYELIARVVKIAIIDSKEYETAQTVDVLETLARFFATKFEKNNPKFDRDKFLRACGVSE